MRMVYQMQNGRKIHSWHTSKCPTWTLHLHVAIHRQDYANGALITKNDIIEFGNSIRSPCNFHILGIEWERRNVSWIKMNHQISIQKGSFIECQKNYVDTLSICFDILCFCHCWYHKIFHNYRRFSFVFLCLFSYFWLYF